MSGSWRCTAVAAIKSFERKQRKFRDHADKHAWFIENIDQVFTPGLQIKKNIGIENELTTIHRAYAFE